MKIELLSISDKNGLECLYRLLNSLKYTKKQQTQIHYRLIIEDLDQAVEDYFAQLVSDDFKLEYIELTPFKEQINLPQKGTLCKANYYTMVRCLCPAYFKQLDKLLYLDTDIIFLQHGVEQLWQTDLTDYYIAGVEDIIINKTKNLEVEKLNAKNEHYINGGVLLLNLKLIREAKLDQQLVEWCKNWKTEQLKPYYLDQSLFNYLFKEKTKPLNFKFNDYSLVLTTTVYLAVKDELKEKYGYEEPINSVKEAVIVHFLGDMKPWGRTVHRLKAICLYYPALLKIWQHIDKQLRKSNEQEESTEV